MTSIESSIMLTVIAYPMIFVVMAVFAVLTYYLNKLFPRD